MKRKSPKFPRRSWVINPVTKVKQSKKIYRRRQHKQHNEQIENSL